MGEVWEARDTKLDWDVALKVLSEAFTSGCFRNQLLLLHPYLLLTKPFSHDIHR